jgi:hypothetical protein
MASIINGSSPTVTFSDGTTQATSAIVSGYVPYANLPAGSVLQVVQTSWNSFQGTSTSTFSDVTGGSLSITPKFSSSKILILVSVANAGKATNNTYLNFLLQRNGSNICFINGFGMTQTSLETNANITINYLDSPATTSSTTYKLQLASGNNNSQAWLNNYQATIGTASSSITLMEIAG